MMNWTDMDIIDSLETGNCIVFIGPYAFQNEKNESIAQALHTYLELSKIAADGHRRIKRYYKDDDLFLLKKTGYRNKVAHQIRTFYESQFCPSADVLEKIAQIPFSLIINLSPDNFIKNTFEQSNVSLPFYHDFYDIAGAIPEEYVPFDHKRPLIYNLLGYLEKEESLILTHSDLFDYLTSFFQVRNKMHDSLTDYIQNAEGVSYIFLGLPIDKWYTQLILRFLKLDKKSDNELERWASLHNDHYNQVIFKDQFHLNIEEVSVHDFVEQLYRECEKEGLLKAKGQGKAKPTFDPKAIQNLIVNAKIEKGIDALSIFLEYLLPRSYELYSEILMTKNRFEELKKNKRSHLITPDNYDVELAQITKNLLDFIGRIKEEVI